MKEATIPGNPKILEPLLGKWRNLFVSNQSLEDFPNLMHLSSITADKKCCLVDDDLCHECNIRKSCLVGYVSGKFPGLKALNNIIMPF